MCAKAVLTFKGFLIEVLNLYVQLAYLNIVHWLRGSDKISLFNVSSTKGWPLNIRSISRCWLFWKNETRRFQSVLNGYVNSKGSKLHKSITKLTLYFSINWFQNSVVLSGILLVWLRSTQKHATETFLKISITSCSAFSQLVWHRDLRGAGQAWRPDRH